MLDAEANALIGIPDIHNDPLFYNVKGYDAASDTRYAVAVLDSGLDLDHPCFGADVKNNRTDAEARQQCE